MKEQRTFIHIEMRVDQKPYYFYSALVRAFEELETYKGNEILTCDIQQVGVEADD